MSKSITRLSSGGIIANYKCPAACSHCLYGCSPAAEPGYMDEATAARICGRLYSLGCRSLHIGGGEPFLNPTGLACLIKVINNSGLQIDYIETNAAWITEDDNRNRQILSDIVNAGGDCIMVSADPFHVEFIPFWKPLALIRLLCQTGVQHFIWQERYLLLLQRLDPQKAYNAADLETVFGYDVTGECAREYGMSFNGRALNLLRKYGKKKPAEQLIGDCPELNRTGHFHVDYLGRYIPPGCTGMGILLEDVGGELDSKKYPVMSRLFDSGIRELLFYGQEQGYPVNPSGYYSKCELCFDVRKYFINKNGENFPDLSPQSYYRQNY